MQTFQLFFLAFFTASQSKASNTFLICDVSGTERFSDGTVNKLASSRVSVEIVTVSKNISIYIDGGDLSYNASVRTKVGKNSSNWSIENLSDENVFHIINVKGPTSESDFRASVDIKINRITGFIEVNKIALLDKFAVNTVLSGECQKLRNKKF